MLIAQCLFNTVHELPHLADAHMPSRPFGPVLCLHPGEIHMTNDALGFPFPEAQLSLFHCFKVKSSFRVTVGRMLSCSSVIQVPDPG